MTQLAQAAVIATASNGSLIVTSADSGPNHIQANGGASPIVEINAGATLTFGSGSTGILVNSAGYFDPAFNPANPAAMSQFYGFRNAGSITGEADGLNANGYQITLYNSGLLDGPFYQGVDALGSGSVIANAGTINGKDNGIYSPETNNVTVHNTGLIDGDTNNDGTGNGIYLQDGAIIVNTAGTITGGENGIRVRDNGTITNALGARIIGDDDLTGTGSGILFGSDTAALNTTVDIANLGTISGATGVSLGNNVTLHNRTTFNNFGFPVDGGDITGATDGVVGGNNLNLSNGNLCTITGTNDDGVQAGNYLMLDNYGDIKAGSRGVEAGDNATLTNHGADGIYFTLGLIHGNNGDGVNVDNAGTITNNLEATISSTNEDAVDLNYGSVTNHGILTGGTGVGDNGIEVDGGGVTSITNTGSIYAYQGIDINDEANDSLISSGSNTGSNYAYQSIDINGGANDSVISSGSITGIGDLAITLGGGDDSVVLNDGSFVNGTIDGEAGNNTLTFNGGQDSLYDSTGNVVMGSVYNMASITKNDYGTAFIGSIDRFFEVEADSIRINSGALYINGNVYSNQKERTQITVNGGEVGGTNGFLPDNMTKELSNGLSGWSADIDIMNGGGISAGSKPIQIAGYAGPVDAASASQAGFYPSLLPPLDAVGMLTINGDVTHMTGIDSIEAARPPISPNTYIREDIMPQTEIVNGVHSDLIVNHGSYDVSGADIRIAPTDINRTLTDGTYIIVDSNSPIRGFESLGNVGVEFVDTAPDRGPNYASESKVPIGPYSVIQYGANNLNTVLGNFFATVATTDPVPGGNSNLVLNIQHDYQGLPGLTPNQSSLGRAIDASVTNSNPLVQDFIAAMDYSDLSAVQATLASLTPEASMNQAAVLINSGYRLHRMTQEHLAAVRAGQTVPMTAPPVPTEKGAKEAIPAPVASASRRGNAWGAYSYDWQDYNADQSRDDYDGDASSFTAGFDWRVAPSLVLGVVLDGSFGSYDGTGNSSDIDSFRGALYGTWGESTGIYSDFLVGFGTHSLDMTRDFGGILSGFDSNGSTDATSFQALWTLGYTMSHDVIKHGPFIGLEYQYVSVDGYDQDGPVPVSMDDYDVDSFRGLIGYRMNASYQKFRPYAMVAYAHEFEDGGTSATAHFGSAGFQVTGAEFSSAILLSLGTGYALTENLTIDLGYRGEFSVDGEGIDSNGGSIGLNYSF